MTTRFTLQQRSDQIRAKLAEGHTPPPAEQLMNSGRRRTPEKRALLQRIRDEAAAQNRVPPFQAKF